jgi:hypothetical protein
MVVFVQVNEVDAAAVAAGGVMFEFTFTVPVVEHQLLLFVTV